MMRRGGTVLLSILAFGTALVVGTAGAEPIGYYMPEDVSYDDAIPTPESVIGHGIGDKPVRHDQMVAYLRALADASDRISTEVIGQTHEGRPILFFTVTSPENHGRIDEIRAAHLQRLRPEEDEANEGADTPDDPLVIWLNYGVHGAESAGMDAIMPALYHYAAATSDEVADTLDNAVILAVGILNPDGHARRADHVETFGGVVPVTDPDHHQHQLWIEARTNHYWFDLNRQWLPVSQPEALAWTTTWQKWKPAVSGDFHEMGSNASYYFHPGEPKRKNSLIPDEAREIASAIATEHQAFFDAEQRLYYSAQGFDNFYIGKGSTYPQVNGGIGILFEVGAARGGRIDTPSGERQYGDNIRMHFRTTLSTVKGALAQKERIQRYQAGFYDDARADAADDERAALLVSAPGDSARLARFVSILLAHDIAVHEIGETIEAGGKRFAPGSAYAVPVDQDQYRMIRGIFDRVTAFEESIFYDVSGWTLPLAYDLDVATAYRQATARGDDETGVVFTDSLLGDRVTEASPPAAPAPAEADYGYAFDWRSHFAPRALSRLLAEDVLVRIATEEVAIPTEDGSVAMGPGAVFVPLDRQTVARDEIHGLVETIARTDGITVHAAASGAEPGGTAVGGPSFQPVTEPKIVLAFDDGIARTDAGAIWHLLDHDMRLPVLLRKKDDLAGLDWSQYTHLILPGGRGAPLSEEATALVSRWVAEEGGTVIALRHAAQWGQDAFLAPAPDPDAPQAGAASVPMMAPTTPAPQTPPEQPTAQPPAPPPASVEEDGNDVTRGDSDEADDADAEATDPDTQGGPDDDALGRGERFAYDSMRDRDAIDVIGGAIVAADVDPSHPLGYGYADRFLPVLRNTTETLDWPEANPFAIPVAYADEDVVLSGYVSDRRADEIAGTPMAIAERRGRGAVVLLADDVAFRGMFVGTNRLLMNALFFSGLIETPSADYQTDE